MISCPLCRRTMETVNISGVEIDFCRNGCKGVWFDNYELIKLDELHEGQGPILEEILTAPPVDDTRSEKLICPRCDVALRRRKYRSGSSVEIDNCYSCNGIFLDSGELAMIRDNYEDIQEQSQVFLAAIEEKLAEQATPQPEIHERGVGILSRLFGR